MTFKVEISPHKSNNSYALRIRISHKQKRVFVPLGISVKKTHFKNGVVKGSKIDSKVNDIIELTLNRLKILSIENPSLSPSELKNIYLSGDKSDRILVKDLINKKAALYDVQVSKETFLSKTKTFLEFKPNVYVDEINQDLLTKYENYLRKKGNSETTIHSNFVKLKSALNYGVNNDLISVNPVNKYKIASPSPEPKVLLSIEQIKILEEIELSGLMGEVRDFYLFCFYCHGARVNEILNLTWSSVSETQIKYKPSKTLKKTNKTKIIAISNGLYGIIERIEKRKPNNYVFKFLENSNGNVKTATALINKYLYKIADKLEWERFSTSTARHSFSTILANSGIPTIQISKLLLHQKVSTTDSYLNSMREQDGKGILDNIMNNDKR